MKRKENNCPSLFLIKIFFFRKCISLVQDSHTPPACPSYSSSINMKMIMPIQFANWTGHILRRNCLPQRVSKGKIQGGIEVTERQGRRRRNLLDDLKERRGYSHLKEEALERSMWSARFGRGFGSVVRQTTK
jgi:hypothetical protein